MAGAVSDPHFLHFSDFITSFVVTSDMHLRHRNWPPGVIAISRVGCSSPQQSQVSRLVVVIVWSEFIVARAFAFAWIVMRVIRGESIASTCTIRRVD